MTISAAASRGIRPIAPHFEKTLYDNAMLALCYTEAWQNSRMALYRQVAEATLDYCLRELRADSGGFYCGQDADSGGEEGAHYLFTPAEVKKLLGEDDGRHFCECYDITDEGNFHGKSIPNLLLVILLQAVLGKASIFSISFIIGITSWPSIAKVVRTEVKQIRNSGYVIAARCMGGSFQHVLWKHLTPNFASSIMFMVVMNIRSAIIAESTLSFMGIGLPLEQISWGSMLSNADKALMTKSWWIILIPGLFLTVTLMCMTNLGNYLRKAVNRKESYL